MNELLIKKYIQKDKKDKIIDNNKKNISLLIGTINDLINVINIRIDLNTDEKKCIEEIKNNISGILDK